MRTIWKVLAWAMVLAVSLSIFLFSHQPAEESDKVSRSTLEGVLQQVVPDYQKMEPAEQESMIQKYHGKIRNCAHFGLYLLWGFAVGCLLTTYQMNKKTLSIITVTAGILYAVSDEIHQKFIPGRAMEFSDVCTDTGGVLVGLTIFLLIGFCVMRKRKHIISEK